MKFTLKINDVKSIAQIPGYWNDADFISLLEELDFTDAKDAKPEELPELLAMALSDCEPPEAAAILLKYKLSEKLNAGQIQNLSHEMVEDDESEENANMDLHYPLFNINQLLYSAFNGVFQKATATRLEFEFCLVKQPEIAVTKEIALKAMCSVLNDRNLIKRLFEDQIKGEEPFNDADNIVWELHDHGSDKFTMITADNWINKEDLEASQIEGSITLYKEEED